MDLGRSRRKGFLAWGALWLLLAAVRAQDAGAIDMYRFAPAPAWVLAARPEYEAAAPPNGGSGDSWILALDRQIRVTSTGDDHYRHYAVRLLNDTGVENESQISLTVDPTYQAVDIHFIRIVRGKTVIDAQPRARITAVPQEPQLQNRIYNGRYNIDVLLSDVRVGDVLEYAYTTHSQEKLFPGHYAATFGTGWSRPVHWQRIRVLSPADSPLHVRMGDGSAPPPFKVRDGVRELLLTFKDTRAMPADSDTPDWYFQWPYVQISDRGDWAGLGSLIDPVFLPALRKGERVSRVAAGIKAEGGPLEEQALRALQYVQEHVRYASIAIGPGTHRPSDPDTVLERRYGDCKDKSVLLVALLRELGIPAQLALVHSSQGRALPQLLPTPYAFDHMIVRMQVGGKAYWVDGTAAKQYSPLDTNVTPDFKHALLVGRASEGLVSIPTPAPDARRREIWVTLDVQRGIDKPGTLTVKTRYFGALADDMRPVLESGTPEQRESDYANYTARYYPSAKLDGPIRIEDDKERDEITVHERYVLDSPFAANQDKQLELMLHADELYRHSEPLSATVRRAPLALSYPSSVRQQITVYLPKAWEVKPEKVKVDNPAFRYRSEVDYAAQTLTLNYEYEALSDHVAVAALKQYLADRKRMYDDLGYALWHTPGAESSTTTKNLAIAPLPLFVWLATFVLACWAAIRWGYRFDPPGREVPEGAPVGIAGWLLLPAFGVVVGPLVTLWVLREFSVFIGAEIWYALDSTVREGTAGWAQLWLLFMGAMCCVLLSLQLLLCVLFFQTRTSAPALFVAILWLDLLVGAFALGWLKFTGLDREMAMMKEVASLGRDFIGATIWTIYLLVSRRVAATFQRRRTPPVAAPEPAAAIAP